MKPKLAQKGGLCWLFPFRFILHMRWDSRYVNIVEAIYSYTLLLFNTQKWLSRDACVYVREREREREREWWGWHNKPVLSHSVFLYYIVWRFPANWHTKRFNNLSLSLSLWIACQLVPSDVSGSNRVGCFHHSHVTLLHPSLIISYPGPGSSTSALIFFYFKK